MTERMKYVFGPVPSRRLGLSLGVDIVPFKTCTQNCIYCQLGRNAVTTSQRKAWVPTDDVLAELRQVLGEGVRPDYITISGSGEPTLNSDLGPLIDGIRMFTEVPVAVITNGTLLSDPAVRADCCKADVILPSLDAGDEATFQLVNRPHDTISLQRLVDGLCALRSEYAGQIWLEIFIIEGVNSDADQVEKIRELIGHIAPDKVHLNTAVRPTAERGVSAASPARLAEIAHVLGPKAEVIADFSAGRAASIQAGSEDILRILRRRPCTMEDICGATGLKRLEVAKHVEVLLSSGIIETESRNNAVFYRPK